jgi:hypothetical protein
MEKSDWIKIERGTQMPEDGMAVHIFVRDKDGLFNIFMAHTEEGVWFVYDPFEHKFRIYTRQQYVTHFRYFSEYDIPQEFRKDAA